MNGLILFATTKVSILINKSILIPLYFIILSSPLSLDNALA